MFRCRAGAFRVSVLLILILVLGACAGGPPGRHTPQQELSRYGFEGRFSLRQGEQAFSGRISWFHAPARDHVLIQDPFGGGVAEIDRGSALTRLTLADGRVSEDPDPEALVLRLTGMPLPVNGLGEWLTGRVAAGAGAAPAVETDTLGRTRAFDRDGWQVRFDYAEDLADALPVRIFARRSDALELRLSIDRWDPAP